LSRQLDGGVTVWDTNASATAVNPLGGVFHGPGSPLKAAQQASPNMSVLVNAGYVAVPHPTAGHGVYLFGLQDQSTITIASNPAGSSRLDLIVARVYDTGNSSSFCDVEVVEGTAGAGQPATPSASVLLAVVTVPASATSITTSDIADKRTFTVAPGGILPSTTASAPALADGQVLWNTSLSLLQRLASPVTFTQTWDSAGTYTWTFPAGVSSSDWEATGAGSAGGGSGDSNAGGGAGAGEWAGDTITGTPGVTVLTVVVGEGGAASPPGEDSPGAGTASTVSGGSVELVANPGGPGAADGLYGPGGTGSTNARHNNGGAGGAALPGVAGGGGGSSGGPESAGIEGHSDMEDGGEAGGEGAAAVPGGGPGGDGGSDGGPGFAPATGPGGGGGGTGGSASPSGAGADGQVTVTWIVQPTTLTPLALTDSAEDDLAPVNTSTGTSGSSGLTAASGSSYGWGIGYGSTSYTGFFGFREGFDADGSVVPQIQVEFDADGATDFQFDLKWGLAVPEAAVDAASPSIAKGQCRIILQLDGATLDTVYLCCSASGGSTKPGDGGCFTYYTSAQNGTTPGAGTHTATLAVETANTLSGQLSGAHIGNLASVGTSPHPFGGSALLSGFTSALTAENCSLRVAGIQAASV